MQCIIFCTSNATETFSMLTDLRSKYIFEERNE